MKKSLRIVVTAALVGGTLWVGGPASATCRPEDKVPCETDFPPLREIVDNCSTSFDPGLPVTLGICDF